MKDDFVGYEALFANDLTEVGCMAHARRKRHALWVSQKSPLAEGALTFDRPRYDIERTAATAGALRPAFDATGATAPSARRCPRSRA